MSKPDDLDPGWLQHQAVSLAATLRSADATRAIEEAKDALIRVYAHGGRRAADHYRDEAREFRRLLMAAVLSSPTQRLTVTPVALHAIGTDMTLSVYTDMQTGTQILHVERRPQPGP